MKPVGRIVFHIGLHKTGTSTIQDSLKGYDQDGVRYAGFRSSNHGPIIKGILEQEPWEKNAAARSAFERELDRPCEVLIVSAEAMSKLSRAEATELVAAASRFAEDVEALCFVREPVGWLTSAIQQNLKTGVPVLGKANMSYKRRLQPWIEALGAARTRIAVFEPGSFVNGSLIDTFFEVSELPSEPPPEKTSNEGLSADAVRVLFLISLAGSGTATPSNSRAFGVLRKALQQDLPGSKLTLPPSALPAGRMKQDTRWLCEVSGIDFREKAALLNPDLAQANALLTSHMTEVPADSASRIIAAAAARTGGEAKTAREAAALYFAWATAGAA